MGTGTINTNVVGFSSPDLSLSTIITSGITAGSTYLFSYRASNILGWGPFSDPIAIKAADIPDSVATPTTSIENIFVKISWT